jgi:hypothetical protein
LDLEHSFTQAYMPQMHETITRSIAMFKNSRANDTFYRGRYLFGLMRLLDLSWHERTFFCPVWSDWANGNPPPTSLTHLVRLIFAWLCSPMGDEAWRQIEWAATTTQETGSALLDSAATAESEDGFYDKLHESCGWSHGAAEGFGYLLANAALGPEDRERMRRGLKDSREFGIVASTSLMHRYRHYRSKGAQLAARQGSRGGRPPEEGKEGCRGSDGSTVRA